MSDRGRQRYRGPMPAGRHPKLREQRKRAAENAATEIYERRYHLEDPNLHWLKEGLLAVADHANTYDAGIPAAVIHQDVADVIKILRWLSEVNDLVMLAAIRMGRKHKMTWLQLAAAVGVDTKQGAENLYKRLVNACEGTGTRDDALLRAHNAWEKEHQAWRAKRSADLAACIVRLQSHRAELPAEIQETVDELAANVPAPNTASTFGWHRTLLRLLRQARKAPFLPEPVVEALATVTHLVSDEPVEPESAPDARRPAGPAKKTTPAKKAASTKKGVGAAKQGVPKKAASTRRRAAA
jgi:hypothetical protein